jgi:hypothetical protein
LFTACPDGGNDHKHDHFFYHGLTSLLFMVSDGRVQFQFQEALQRPSPYLLAVSFLQPKASLPALDRS